MFNVDRYLMAGGQIESMSLSLLEIRLRMYQGFAAGSLRLVVFNVALFAIFMTWFWSPYQGWFQLLLATWIAKDYFRERRNIIRIKSEIVIRSIGEM